MCGVPGLYTRKGAAGRTGKLPGMGWRGNLVLHGENGCNEGKTFGQSAQDLNQSQEGSLKKSRETAFLENEKAQSIY
jgi:hypothetical protein